MTERKLLTKDEAAEAMTQRLTARPKDPAQRANAIQEAAVWN
jgi:hypothetical protein